MTTLRASAGFVRQVLAWAVILGAVGALAVAVFIPRLAGATPYTILTGSMRPHLPPGTLVVVKPVDPAEIHIGDVVTYQISSGQPEVATHRILRVGTNMKGQRTFIFKGDANSSPDPTPVLPVQLRGRLWYAVPYLGYVNQAMTGHQRQIAVYVVVTALLAYAAYMFTSAARERTTARRRNATGTIDTNRDEEE